MTVGHSGFNHARTPITNYSIMLISNHLGKNLVEIDLKALATQYDILIINQTLRPGTNGIRGMATGQNYQLNIQNFDR